MAAHKRKMTKKGSMGSRATKPKGERKPGEAAKNSPRLSMALMCAKAGLPVVPLHGVIKDGSCTCGNADCKRPGNHPRTRNGLPDATTDPLKIKKMWNRSPKAKIAIALGNGLIAVVVKNEAGREALKKLESPK
jgi:hypothetical protein